MSIFNQMKQTKDKVRFLLQKYPHLRDDDYKLIATFWKFEGGEKIYAQTGRAFLQDVAEGKYTNPETIRRNRACIQKNDPSLRGASYAQRQEEGILFGGKLIEM